MLCDRDLAAHRRGRLLAPALPRAQRAEDVVEADDTGREVVILAVVAAEELGDELLPPIAVLGLGRKGVLLAQGRHLGVRLEVLRIDARGRGVQVALDPVAPGRLDRVQVDQRVRVQDLGVMGRDVAHPAHVGGERVDLINARRRLHAGLDRAQVADDELVRLRARELGRLQVDAAHPVPVRLQVRHEVVADEPPCPGHENTRFRHHIPTNSRGTLAAVSALPRNRAAGAYG